MGNQANSPGAPFLMGQLGSRVAPAHCQEHRGVSVTGWGGGRCCGRKMAGAAPGGQSGQREEAGSRGAAPGGRERERPGLPESSSAAGAGAAGSRAKQQAMGTWSPKLCG